MRRSYSKPAPISFCEESPALLEEAAVVSKPHYHAQICLCKDESLPTGRSQFGGVYSTRAAVRSLSNPVSSRSSLLICS